MNADPLAEMVHQNYVRAAEGEAYQENEVRKLLAAGVSADHLSAVFAFAHFQVDLAVSATLRKAGFRKGADGSWSQLKRGRVIRERNRSEQRD